MRIPTTEQQGMLSCTCAGVLSRRLFTRHNPQQSLPDARASQDIHGTLLAPCIDKVGLLNQSWDVHVGHFIEPWLLDAAHWLIRNSHTTHGSQIDRAQGRAVPVCGSRRESLLSCFRLDFDTSSEIR